MHRELIFWPLRLIFMPMRTHPKSSCAAVRGHGNGSPEVLTDDMPAIRLGAEVQYFEGICRVCEVDLLRLEGSQVLLLEMPFCEWSSRMVKDVLDLNRRPDYTVLLAHIERYLQWQPEEVWQELQDEGVLMQSIRPSS